MHNLTLSNLNHRTFQPLNASLKILKTYISKYIKFPSNTYWLNKTTTDIVIKHHLNNTGKDWVIDTHELRISMAGLNKNMLGIATGRVWVGALYSTSYPQLENSSPSPPPYPEGIVNICLPLMYTHTIYIHTHTHTGISLRTGQVRVFGGGVCYTRPIFEREFFKFHHTRSYWIKNRGISASKGYPSGLGSIAIPKICLWNMNTFISKTKEEYLLYMPKFDSGKKISWHAFLL